MVGLAIWLEIKHSLSSVKYGIPLKECVKEASKIFNF